MPATTTTICAFCHVAVESDDATACGVCGTRHHVDCWEQNEGCAVALCSGGPALPFIGGGTAGDDGGRLLIDFEPEARQRASRRGTYVGLGLAALVVVIGLIALIAGGSGTPSPSAGEDAGAQVQEVPPAKGAAVVRPLPAKTAATIATEKRRVKGRATRAARKQRAHRLAAEQAAARRRQQVTPSPTGNGAGSAPSNVTGNPLVRPSAGTRKPDTSGSQSGRGTEQAQPLVDNSFDN